MKHTAGYAKPRRMTAPRRRARLNLQRRPAPEPADDVEQRQGRTFWRWVVLVALLHVLAIVGAYVFFLLSSTPKPPEQFITLLPPGDTVKGTAGVQQAHKVGANTPAAPSHHASPPPPAAAAPKATPPAEVKAPTPVPIVNDTAPAIVPVKPAPVKTAPPKPKVKVDLHEVERADVAAAEPAKKPVKHHAKKPVKKPDDTQDDADSSPDNTGLSKDQIAEALGEKLNASGSNNAQKYGESGAPGGHKGEFDDFYDMIKNQVHDAWNSPMAPTRVEPYVSMRVERDGRVVPESVHLITSSGDPAYDQAAVATVKNLGYLREPLPEGCPPVITIGFNPNSSP
jgi:outer membrane biosynthesis protein TonB